MDLTHQDFLDFFTEMKKGVYVCNFCGSESFIPLMGYGGNPAPMTISVPPTVVYQGGHHFFYGISCANCGKSDLFNINQVHAWKQRKLESAWKGIPDNG